MHKLIEYICDELEDMERKVEKGEKLTMAEVEYADTLAHMKKNLLKSDEMMDEGGEYSSARESYRRGQRRDAMGRYSRGRSMADAIYSMMDDMPENARRDAERLAQKIERSNDYRA